MILEEAIQRVQSLYSAGVQSRSSRLSSRHIYSALCSARGTLLRQQLNKGQAPTQWTYTPLPCIELIKASAHECDCIPAAGCVILRTKYKLPRPINTARGSAIQYVTSLDGSISFDTNVSFSTNKYRDGNKFTSKKPAFFIKNQYGFITVRKMLAALTISMIPYDFLEARNFPSLCPCADCECQDIMKLEFPFDGDLSRPLIQLANEELINIMKQVKEDKTNNASDDTNIGGAMVHANSNPNPNNEE